jgi:uncharacterized membrane-anchored protein
MLLASRVFARRPAKGIHLLRRIVLAACLLAMIGATASPDQAGIAAPPTTEQTFATALRESIGGPSRVDLGDQASERLDAGFLFVPGEPAEQLLRVSNLDVPPDFAGLLLGPHGMRSPGILRFVPSGFIDTDTAPTWTGDDMLASLKGTVEHANAARIAANLEAREVRGWIVPPRYNGQTHQLVWSVLVLPKGAPRDLDGEITVHAVGFGREGYVALSVTTSVQQAVQTAQMADLFLAGLNFRPGKAYADALPADRRAASGLAGAMEVDRLRKAHGDVSFWSSDTVFPVAGGTVASFGALALVLYVQRNLRREARRG